MKIKWKSVEYKIYGTKTTENNNAYSLIRYVTWFLIYDDEWIWVNAEHCEPV